MAKNSKKSVTQVIEGLIAFHAEHRSQPPGPVIPHEQRFIEGVKRVLREYEEKTAESTPKVVTPVVKVEAQRLWVRGMSQRAIANKLGISRGSVIRALR